jgi:four helix bundle protein
MRVERFEDLAAWGKARERVNLVYAITKKQMFCRDRVLFSQMRRAAISVMSNISEGFERRSDKEFARFLRIAKGSCGEVRSQLIVAFDQGYLDETEFRVAETLARRASGTIGNLIKYLVVSHPNGSKSGLKGRNDSSISEAGISSPLEPQETDKP